MKVLLCTLFLLLSAIAFTQTSPSAGNVFIITTDGFRWQEVYGGADSMLIRNPDFVKDTSLIKEQYWDADIAARRRKLLPFFWNVIAQNGQLSGNRTYDNNVNVANWYKISYPGYNEILTGYADSKFIPNLAVRNRNRNILSYLNAQKAYQGKVAAFSSWNVLPYILDEQKSSFPVNGGYELLEENEDTINALINQVQQRITPQTHTRHDLLTYESAKAYIEQQHPKVVFIGFGETDEFAHKGQYDQYLQKAHQFDMMLAELWYYVQTDPFYKSNTTFIITTDHGRGRKGAAWRTHGFWVKGSGETWMAMIGPGIEARGELKEKDQTYQKQIAATVSVLLGEHFTANHPVGQPIQLPTAITTINKTAIASATADK